MTGRPSLSRCFIFWSVSTKRGKVSSDASSIGVWEVPAANTILAMLVSACAQSIRMFAALATAAHLRSSAAMKAANSAAVPGIGDGAELGDARLHVRRAQAFVDGGVEPAMMASGVPAGATTPLKVVTS